jgi:hypothetical protein
MGNIASLQHFKKNQKPNHQYRSVPPPRLSGRGSAQPPLINHEIGMLAFRCPLTQKDIASGIEMDRKTFLRNRQLCVRVFCRACHDTHKFEIESGRLAPYRAAH